MRALIWTSSLAIVGLIAAPARAAECGWSFPVGDSPDSPAPLHDNHPVNGNNLPAYGAHLGADFWSGGGCTDFGQAVYAVADGQVVEIVDALGSYLDVVVIRHEVDGIGNVYSMYGHIERDGGLAEGQAVEARQQIGEIDDVLAYFSPCHLHFELLNESAYQNGPFCNGCQNAGYHVSPGYDQNKGVTMGIEPTGDAFIEVDDAIAGNRWYFVDEFLQARVGDDCDSCGDGICDAGESEQSCPSDCSSGDGDGDTDTGWGDGDGDTDTGWGDGDGDGDPSGDGDTGWDGDSETSAGDSGEDTDVGSDSDGTGAPELGDLDDSQSGCTCAASSPDPWGSGGAWLGLVWLLLFSRPPRRPSPGALPRG